MFERAALIHRAMRYRYKLDPAEVSAAARLVPPGGCAVDLGAHKGAYTWWLARAAGRRGRVVAVEPQPELAQRLRGLFARHPGVSVVHAAAADASGAATLHVRGLGPSHGASIHGFSDRPAARTVEVPTVSLPDLVAREGLTRLDLVKCDTEGAELEIFAAAGDVLRRLRPAVLCECEARHGADGPGHVRALINLFRDAGYDAAFFYGRRLIDADRFDPDTHQVYGSGHYGNNFLFTPPAHNWSQHAPAGRPGPQL